ncbi:MAG TPA: cytochrome c maturation protein CcmE [Alphaproteobacteria bacterium]|nr:cytochrome c maturation protein CcmE [Alphaproteobacteria bacterium]
MKRKHKRLTFVVIALVLLAVATALVLSAFRENIVFFYSPTDLTEKKIPADRRVRIGGLVEKGSIKKSGITTTFRITDNANVIKATYTGILPDLFHEGKGVVAEGVMVGGVFKADEVLAKHDENYMPPEVAAALKKAGQWQGANGKKK